MALLSQSRHTRQTILTGSREKVPVQKLVVQKQPWMPSLNLCSGPSTKMEVPHHLLIGLSTDMEKFVAMNKWIKRTANALDHKENAAGPGLTKTRMRRTHKTLIVEMWLDRELRRDTRILTKYAVRMSLVFAKTAKVQTVAEKATQVMILWLGGPPRQCADANLKKFSTPSMIISKTLTTTLVNAALTAMNVPGPGPRMTMLPKHLKMLHSAASPRQRSNRSFSRSHAKNLTKVSVATTAKSATFHG